MCIFGLLKTLFSAVKHWIILILLVFLQTKSILFGQYAEEMVSVINYSKNELNIGQQTWQIETKDKNVTYFANNGGLLLYDGKNWEKLNSPNQTIIRSVKKEGDRIYIGTQGEFGYFLLKEYKYQYISLSKLLAFKKYNDIWHIETYGQNEVFFRADESIFYFDGKKVLRLQAGSGKYNYLGKVGNKIILQDSEGFLFEYNRGEFQKIQGPSGRFDKGRIVSILSYEKDTVLVATIYDGIFYKDENGFHPWKTKYDNILKKYNIYCADYLPGKGLGLGTSYNGVYVIDQNRNLIAHSNKSKGLQNNSVLSLRFTLSGDIWAGLDNGVSYLQMSSQYRYISPDEDLEGTGYSACFYKNKYFFGTNTGVYFRNETETKSKLLAGTEGQVWHLQILKDKLLINHHNGLFVYDGQQLIPLSKKNGWWKIVALTDSLAIAGNYDGLYYLDYKNGNFSVREKKSAFQESCRFIETDLQKNVWIAHPYRGIYTIERKDWEQRSTKVNVLTETSPDGTPFYFSIFPHKKGVLLQSKKGFYLSNDGKSFIRDTFLERYLDPTIELRMYKNDGEGNVWYSTTNETGLLIKNKNLPYRKKWLNEIHGRLPEGFQSVAHLSNQKIIFPLDKGFVFLDKNQVLQSDKFVDGFVSKITYSLPFADSSLYYTKSDSLISLSLPYDFINLFVFLSGTHSPHSEFVTYSYRIDKNQWSSWSKDHVIRLHTLTSGKHEIQVRMMNENGSVRQTGHLMIKISYPWYRSPFAFFMYFVFLSFIIYRYVKYIRENHRKEVLMIESAKALQEQKHLAEKEHTQNEIIRLQNEKLTDEINFKNQELASFTYHLVSKNELIQGINDEITKLEKKYPDHKNLLKDLRNIHRLAEQNINADQDWEKFISNFDQVHSEFFKRLTETYPDLSPSDYKLCTYLRMNLTSKEIASIMNISLRSVETNRYRLRKKMQLDTDTNLVQFLINF